MSTIKQSLLELVQSLPEECTWDDVMYRIYVRQKIEEGIRAADDGDVVSHQEILKEFGDDSTDMDDTSSAPSPSDL